LVYKTQPPLSPDERQKSELVFAVLTISIGNGKLKTVSGSPVDDVTDIPLYGTHNVSGRSFPMFNRLIEPCRPSIGSRSLLSVAAERGLIEFLDRILGFRLRRRSIGTFGLISAVIALRKIPNTFISQMIPEVRTIFEQHRYSSPPPGCEGIASYHWPL
jgi:hypothetical protein